MASAYDVGQGIIDLVTEVSTQFLEVRQGEVVSLVEGLATKQVEKAITEAYPSLKTEAEEALREAVKEIDVAEIFADNVDWDDLVKACLGESSFRQHLKKAAESAVESEIDDCDFDQIVKDNSDLSAIASEAVDEILRDRVDLKELAEVLVRTDAFWVYVTSGMDYHQIGKILDAKVNFRFDESLRQIGELQTALVDQLQAVKALQATVDELSTPWWVKITKVVRSWIS
jgi:hypothetical protein